MKRIIGLLSGVLATGILVAATLLQPMYSAQALSLNDKAALQAAMQQDVDRQTVNDAYLYLDMEAGKVRSLYPVTAHPMIMQMGEHFVLCFDFLDPDGNTVQADFYLSRKANSFVVFHTAVASRAALMALIEDGRVKPTD